MSNGSPQNGSIWPVVTVIVGMVALAAVGWNVMLQGRLKKMEERLTQVESRSRAAAAAPAKAAPKPAATDAPAPPRRRGKGAATQPGAATMQATTKPNQQ
jgi:hypothetical protein